MIHPKAVKEFLNAERDSHSWLKSIPESEIDKALADLDPPFRPAPRTRPLTPHQKVCLLLGISYPAFAFWLDMGLGKTRIALELLRYWHKCGRMFGALILSPSEMTVIGWEKQIREWNIDLPYVTLLNSSSAEKWEQLSDFDGGLILGTYAGVVAMLTKLKAIKDKPTKKKHRVPNDALIARLAAMLDAVVMDESTKAQKKSSLVFRICNRLRKKAPIWYMLAGRPFGREPTALWSQHYLVDRGETLGDTLGMFRAGFFEEHEHYWAGREWKFNKSMQPKLARVLEHRSITYDAKECLKLPPVVPILEEVSLPREAASYYEAAVEEIRRSRGNARVVENAFLRMRQISSGFIGFKDDDTGERAQITFAQNPKLDAMLDLIDEMPRDRKFVIFYEFTYSGRRIVEALKKEGIKAAWVWGGSKNMRQLQEDFDHDDRTHGMVLNWRKGAFGGNLQRANYVFFYESPVPVIEREQAEKRVPRQGQKRTTFQYDLVTRGTADGRILQFHREGASLFKALLRNPDLALGLGKAPKRAA